MVTNVDKFIRAKFSLAGPYQEFGIEIPEGFADLAEHMFKLIYAICASFRFKSKLIVVTQVKTKMNWLRVYVHFKDGVPEQARELILNTVSLFESASADMLMDPNE